MLNIVLICVVVKYFVPCRVVNRALSLLYWLHSMADLSRDDILKLARLSKLELTNEEVERFTREIEAVVDFVEQLQTADVSGLEPTNQVTGLSNVIRADETRKYSSQADLLKNLPDREGDYIKVKRMIS